MIAKSAEHLGHARSPKQLVEYCCTGSDELGLAAHAHDVSCLRLGDCAVDLANPNHVLQIEDRLLPGAHVWFSLPSVSKGSANACKPGSHSKARAAKRKSKASEVTKHALRVAKNVISSGGHVSFAWPADDDAWSASEWSQFEDGFHSFRLYFRGPLEGKEAPIRHRWAVSTASLRMLQLFGQHDLEGGIPGEAKGPNPGSTFECTANFANLVIESYFPEKFYRHIPSMLSSNALVTRNLTGSEWVNDERGVEAVKAEATGLRANDTWDDTSAQPLWTLKRIVASRLQISTLCAGLRISN